MWKMCCLDFEKKNFFFSTISFLLIKMSCESVKAPLSLSPSLPQTSSIFSWQKREECVSSPENFISDFVVESWSCELDQQLILADKDSRTVFFWARNKSYWRGHNINGRFNLSSSSIPFGLLVSVPLSLSLQIDRLTNCQKQSSKWDESEEECSKISSSLSQFSRRLLPLWPSLSVAPSTLYIVWRLFI